MQLLVDVNTHIDRLDLGNPPALAFPTLSIPRDGSYANFPAQSMPSADDILENVQGDRTYWLSFPPILGLQEPFSGQILLSHDDVSDPDVTIVDLERTTPWGANLYGYSYSFSGDALARDASVGSFVSDEIHLRYSPGEFIPYQDYLSGDFGVARSTVVYGKSGHYIGGDYPTWFLHEYSPWQGDGEYSRNTMEFFEGPYIFESGGGRMHVDLVYGPETLDRVDTIRGFGSHDRDRLEISFVDLDMSLGRSRLGESFVIPEGDGRDLVTTVVSGDEVINLELEHRNGYSLLHFGLDDSPGSDMVIRLDGDLRAGPKALQLISGYIGHREFFGYIDQFTLDSGRPLGGNWGLEERGKIFDPGDTILNDTGGLIRLRMSDDSTIFLGPQSEITLDASFSGSRAWIITSLRPFLHEGEMRYSRDPDEASSETVIDTPNARIEVIGTDFTVAYEIDPDTGVGRTRIEVESGAVEVTDLESEVTRSFEAGESTTLVEGDSSWALGHVPVSVQLSDRDGAALEGGTVRFIPEVAGDPVTGEGTDAGAAGAHVLALTPGMAGRLEASRSHDPATDPRPTALDALEVLRMAVGLEPSWGAAGPLDFIAADMDGSGEIDAMDALEILRAAVGLDSAHGPRWVFVDSADLPAMDRHSVVYDTGIAVPEIAADLSGLELTGVLLGTLQEHA